MAERKKYDYEDSRFTGYKRCVVVPDDEESELVYGFMESYGNPQTTYLIQSGHECTTNSLEFIGFQRACMD